MVQTSLTAQTYRILRERILDGSFMPRTRLRIDRLSDELSVSAGAIREALSRLTSDGLVVAEPQKGFLVTPISIRDLLDLTSVRIDIETKCLMLSIRDGGVLWESEVLAAHHRLANTPEATAEHTPNPEWLELHAQFHDTLISACQSDWWLRLRTQLFLQAERYRRLCFPYTKPDRDVRGEHKAIVDAALERNAEHAAYLLGEHLQLTADLLVQSKAPFDDAAARSGQKRKPDLLARSREREESRGD